MAKVEIVLSILFISIGWRNYRGPESRKPASPLGKYLLRMAIRQEGVAGNKLREAEVTKRIVRLDAMFALATGLSVILTMVIVLAVALMS